MVKNNVEKSIGILKEFYDKVPSEDLNLYEELANKAISLGYMPKMENKKYGFSISMTNRKLKNTIVMFYFGKKGVYWKLKFHSNKNHTNIFDNILKNAFEKFKYLYNNGTCIDTKCGRCKGEKHGYNIEYNDGKKYFLCGFYLIPIYTISREIVDEAVKMMEIQHKGFLEELE
jgi:hypothetical protein